MRKLGTKQGGEYVDAIHFSYAGSQIRSFLSLVSYFGKGENRERYLGVNPPSNLRPDYLEIRAKTDTATPASHSRWRSSSSHNGSGSAMSS